MNTILQKRIEEAAKRYAWSHDTIGVDKETFHTEASQKHSIPIHNEVRVPIYHEMEVAFKCAAHFILNNLWISVEEALPPRQKNTKGEVLEQSIPVFVRDNEGNYTSAWYSFYSKHWFMGYGEAFLKQSIYSKITHWIEIPSLKGGEE